MEIGEIAPQTQTMSRTLARDVAEHVGENVKVQGWVQTTRDLKSVQFVIVRDHTGVVQVTVDRKNKPDIARAVSELNTESAITIVGEVVKNPHVKLGGLEILISDLFIESEAASSLPIDVFGETETSLDKRLDWRYLDLRRPENYLVFQVQTTAEMAMREFWVQENFIEIHSPKLMGTASESGSELFSMEYFGKAAYLAQSPQFYKQMAMAAGFDKVFEIGPVFRANPSDTSRHDTEFTSVDVEISWIDSHDDVMSFEERWLQYVLEVVKEKHGNEIAELSGTELVVPSLPFPRITMEDALALLKERGYTPPPRKSGDLDPQGERLLSKYVRDEFGHEFVFLKDYPTSVRPFYHMRYENEPEVTKSFDLIWKGLEITTGAQREHRYEVIANQASEEGLNLEHIQFYLDFFRNGCPPHGGFGFGLTRMLMTILGLGNVREVTYLYRGPTRLTP